ncbi:MAG: hypothetical protein ACI84D_002015 [Thalassolituus oleivorans]|jgi:hypothetical protein
MASWNEGSPSQIGRSAGGWTHYTPPEPGVSDAPTTQAEADGEIAGACYVKAPSIPGPSEAVQILKRPERLVTGTDVVIPAEYVTVDVFDDNAEGFAWLPAMCDEDLDRHLIVRVQEALISRGYDIGAVDGIAGAATNAGLEYYKRDHGFYGDGLTYQVLESLGVDPKTSGPAFASR